MKYERLTERDENGIATYKHKCDADSFEENLYIHAKREEAVVKRLADLEDKIENGTLRERPEVTRLIFTRDEKDPVMLITKEEYSNYLVLKNDYAHAKEQCEKLQADNERLYNNIGKFKESVRKETAKEILKSVLEDVGEFYAGDIVEELAKQYGVEVEE